jgi:1-acyl-sn-glycerol-3-phosphate acyltransferase
MIQKLARIAKGVYMFMEFCLFFIGIVLCLISVAPVFWVLGLIKREDPAWMQAVNGKLFSLWLGLLSIGGLLKELTPQGKSLNGPCVIVCNHPGLFDVLFLIRDIPNMMVMVKKTLVTKLPLGPIFKFAGYIVTGGRKGGDTMDPIISALDILEHGYKLQLFPEGTRSPAGGVWPFRAGAFKIARLAGVPIQPIFIRNMPPFLSRKERWYYPASEPSILQLEFWDPIPPPPAGREVALAHDLEKRFRMAVQGLSGARRRC